MRLIDADVLLKTYCSALNGEYKSCRECLEPPYGVCCLEVEGESIYNAPTIDAIPVEWLQMRITHAKETGVTEAADAFEFVLKCWEEQHDGI